MSTTDHRLREFHRYTITSEGASLGYFRLVEDPAGVWVTWAEVVAALLPREAPSARPYHLWHDDDGDVLWWLFPICEPPYSGSPLAQGWPFHEDDEHALGWTRFQIPERLSADVLVRTEEPTE